MGRRSVPPLVSGSGLVQTRNRDVNDPGWRARGRPRARSGVVHVSVPSATSRWSMQGGDRTILRGRVAGNRDAACARFECSKARRLIARWRTRSAAFFYSCPGNKQTTSLPPNLASARSNVASRPPFLRARPSRYRSVTCLAVAAARTSGSITGDTPSGHHKYSRLAAVRISSRSAVVSGGHAPPGNCAQTRMAPSSVTADVAHPCAADSLTNPEPERSAHALVQAVRPAHSRQEASSQCGAITRRGRQ